MARVWRMPVALLAAAACAHASAAPEEPPPDSPDALAEQVMIYRDAYGTPHVHGETDAAAVFGLMYAHAEDALRGRGPSD